MFLLKLPLLAAIVWITLWAVPRVAAHRGLPPPGPHLVLEALLVGGAVTALLLAVEQLHSRPPLAALAAVALALALSWSRLTASQPVLALVRRPAFGAVLLALLVTAAGNGVTAFLLPWFVADVLHAGPALTGIALLFYVGAMAPVSALAGVLADRIGPAVVAVAGSAVSIGGMLSLLALDAGSGPGDLAWRLAVFGAGAALFHAPVNAAVLVLAPVEAAGIAGGIATTVRTVAMTIGPATAARARTWAGGADPGFEAGVLTLSAAAAAGLLVLLPVVRTHGGNPSRQSARASWSRPTTTDQGV